MAKQKIVNKKRHFHTKEFKLSAVKMVLEEHLDAAEVGSRIGVKIEDLRCVFRAMAATASDTMTATYSDAYPASRLRYLWEF